MTPAEFRAIRLRSGMTQAELAEYLGVASWKTVQQWESGRRRAGGVPGPVAKLMKQLKDQTEKEEPE